MQEHRVTAAGETRTLPEPFFVLATQNPIEQEGTYALPEAQLDRFLFDIRVGYPDEREEIAILRQTTGAESLPLVPVLSPADAIALQRLVRDVPAAEPALRYAAALVRATRPDAPNAPQIVSRYVRWGAGPRAGQALILGAKAHAVLSGRYAISPADIQRVALPVLRHRVLVSFAAEAEGVSAERIVTELLGAIPERPPLPEAELAQDVARNPVRAQAIRVRLEMRGGRPVVSPTGAQGSHLFTSLLRADCLAMIPQGEGRLAAGTTVKLEPLPA